MILHFIIRNIYIWSLLLFRGFPVPPPELPEGKGLETDFSCYYIPTTFLKDPCNEASVNKMTLMLLSNQPIYNSENADKSQCFIW